MLCTPSCQSETAISEGGPGNMDQNLNKQSSKEGLSSNDKDGGS